MTLISPELPDREILLEIGRRLQFHRKRQNLTLVEVAARTGLSRRTVYRAETGDNPTTLTVVRLLRAYGQLVSLDGLLPEPEISPMAILEAQRGRRG